MDEWTLPSGEELDAFRTQGDPDADAAYRALRSEGWAGSTVDGLRRLALDRQPAAARLWEHVHTTPVWVDYDRMTPAFDVALQNVIASGLALMAGSLVESYASWRGAKVLVRTGRLQQDTLRRLYETAAFASDIALCRGARVGNRAWENVVGVRLMHARVRHLLTARADWEDGWGMPVNQEDYAGTLFMFSLVYRRSLERLGVAVDDEVREANHHVWRHVGWLMGVDERLLTPSPTQEKALYREIRRRQFGPDEDSRRLAAGLLRAMAGRPPFFLPLGALQALSRRLIGERLADEFGFPRSRWWSRVWDSSWWLNAVSSRVARRTPGISRASIRIGEQLTNRIVAAGLPGGATYG